MLSITRSSVFLLFLASTVMSCKKNSLSEGENPSERENRVAVNTVSAIPVNTAVLGREHWHLFVGNRRYAHRFENGLIIAEDPVGHPFEFIVDEDPDRAAQPDEQQANVYFLSPYYVPDPEIIKVKDVSPYPAAFDQTDMQRLKRADVLSGKYVGVPSGDLEKVELRHANALLEFEAVGFPPNGKIYIREFVGEFSPFEHRPDKYMAIVMGKDGFRGFGDPPGTSVAYVEDGVVYTCDIERDGEKLAGDRIYTFTLRFDPSLENRMAVENMTSSIWSEQEW